MARLLVLGSSNTDLTIRLARLPAPGETVLGGVFGRGAGGKGANQAVAAARAGARVDFVSAVGDDEFGRAALSGYRAEGIDVSHVRVRPGRASGVALILVGEAGENLIGVASGANADLGPDDVDALPEALFAPGEVLLIAGLEVPLAAVGRAVERGAAAGMRVVLNPAPADPALAHASWLANVDVLTPNRIELGMLAGRPTTTRDEVADAARALHARGVRSVAATLGAEGCLLVDETVRETPAHRVEAVDAVGAGDTFSAVLAVGLAEGRTLDEAAALANAAAALAVTRPGAQASLPFREEIERLAASAR